MSRLLTALFLTLALSPVSAFAGANYDAKNCEIFIDKFEMSRSSHGVIAITPYVKVLKSRLDGAIVAVGLYNQTTTTYNNNGSPQVNKTPWRDDLTFSSVSPTDDYWSLYSGFAVHSDYSSNVIEGVFYVRTDKGTTYWVKSSEGGNFTFDANAWQNLVNLPGSAKSAYLWSVSTQRPELRYYNPQNCY